MNCNTRSGTYAIGVDIGGSSAKLGIVSESGEIVVRHRVPTPVCSQPERVIEEYVRAIDHLLNRCDEMAIRPVGIGVGMPRHISRDRC